MSQMEIAQRASLLLLLQTAQNAPIRYGTVRSVLPVARLDRLLNARNASIGNGMGRTASGAALRLQPINAFALGGGGMDQLVPSAVRLPFLKSVSTVWTGDGMGQPAVLAARLPA